MTKTQKTDANIKAMYSKTMFISFVWLKQCSSTDIFKNKKQKWDHKSSQDHDVYVIYILTKNNKGL
jgi:hypothetical protein